MKSAWVLFLVLITLSGCGPTLSPDEELAKQIFEAIKQHDEEAYSRLTITSADFDLKRDKVSPFKVGLTYAGSVLRPEMRHRQHKQFEMAIARPTDKCIDFSTCDFAGITGDVTHNQELVGGGSIPTRVRRFLVKKHNTTIDTKEMEPLLLITDWNGKPRVLSLVFREEQQQ